ncbi:MAG: ribonuclease H-like YkuK family protein [Chitinophagales bacterium]
MEPILTAQWRKLDGTRINIPIADAVEKSLVLEKESGNHIKVCIGTDSQVRGSETEFATVIVLLRKGRGGFMFINNEKTVQKMSLKERLLTEVARSIEIAYALCPLFDKYSTELEVHADINTNPRFGSNAALSEAMGYILSMGFTFKAKPDAPAASCCANKVV